MTTIPALQMGTVESSEAWVNAKGQSEAEDGWSPG